MIYFYLHVFSADSNRMHAEMLQCHCVNWAIRLRLDELLKGRNQINIHPMNNIKDVKSESDVIASIAVYLNWRRTKSWWNWQEACSMQWGLTTIKWPMLQSRRTFSCFDLMHRMKRAFACCYVSISFSRDAFNCADTLLGALGSLWVTVLTQ